MAVEHDDAGGRLPRPGHDEYSRQRYAQGFRQYLFGPFRQAVSRDFYGQVAPGFETREGKPLDDRHLARQEILQRPVYQYFSDLHRISQEMIWNSVLDTLDRTESELSESYRQLDGDTLGSLELDPSLETPKYISAIDIHCMPGNYQRSSGDDDLIAGALYDLGGYLYNPGGGPRCDSIGHAGLAFLKTHYPDLRPSRILDMGCGVGGPTLPHLEAFPDAEVFGIDIGAAMLRYGHVRAEALKCKVHFSQQNAEATRFDDGSFDLIVSHIMFHETSADAIQPILNECHRLLAPGGVMLHIDLPSPDLMPDIFTKIVFDGDAYYNNEPFWMRMHDLDWPAMMVKAGFHPDEVQIGLTPLQTYMPPTAEDGTTEFGDGGFRLCALAAHRSRS